MGRFIVVIFALTICAIRSHGAIFPDRGPTTPGPRASLCGGIALAPAQAPLAVKRAIWAATPPFTTAATIVPELFRMLLVVRV